jgi:hypothetical protein
LTLPGIRACVSRDTSGILLRRLRRLAQHPPAIVGLAFGAYAAFGLETLDGESNGVRIAADLRRNITWTLRSVLERGDDRVLDGLVVKVRAGARSTDDPPLWLWSCSFVRSFVRKRRAGVAAPPSPRSVSIAAVKRSRSCSSSAIAA